ncbi:MAG: hypothetical protein EPO51_06445 [Phenylobacterium sp.]|uniref:hypothetical protein n=1 Tax=Phenylobacterium sp. TaxID=1871053 RepID=UPI00121380AC|nr:hypothetical protein [Phenylobacterium sp.]TAJ73271.1 MAG: hypothetical protein EPO51_06445 [Phenylobacterium sp.]
MTHLLLSALIAGLVAGAPAAVPPLTPDGWGELRIGMAEAEAVRKFRLIVPGDDDGVSSEACRELAFPEGGPRLVAMAENGRITRISTFEDGPLRTDRGFGVGSREGDIRKAYGRTLRVETHKYDEEPAHYLTAWTVAGRRGVRFETDRKGVVHTVHVGGPSIEYVEGCL